MAAKNITYINNVGDKKTILIKSSLGEGASGIVYKAILDGFGLIALKVIRLNKSTQTLVENDLNVRKQFGENEDPHFILVRRVILHESMRESKLAMKYPDLIGFSPDIDRFSAGCIYKCADSVDLFEMIAISDDRYPDNLLGIFFTQLCVGLKILHNKQIAHRDIKPENIMMDEGFLKYIDFGFACVKDACFDDSNLGTPMYASPDLVKKILPLEFVSFLKRDIYALGITFYVIITRDNFPVNYKKLASIENDRLLSISYKNIVDRNIPEKWRKLVVNMINPVESERYSIDQCIEEIEKVFM